MDFHKLARKAQEVYTQRGGAKAAKGDASEVGEIFKGDGTLMDKARQAAKALKEPGVSSAAAVRTHAEPPVATQAEPLTGSSEPPSGTQ